MEPVTLVVTALAAGAEEGLKDAAASAVTDAYDDLKTLARKRLAGRHDGSLVLARHEHAPDTWQGLLGDEFTAAGASTDTELIAAAQTLMGLVDPVGSGAGKYAVGVHGSQGVQIGDGNIQHYTYIHTQVVHPFADPATEAPVNQSASPGGAVPPTVPAPSVLDTGQRMRAAAALAQRDSLAAAEVYKMIATDSRVDAAVRMRAAAETAKLDYPPNRFRALDAYKQIVADSRVDIDTRMQAAVTLTRMNPRWGLNAYKDLASDQHVHATVRMQAAGTVAEINENWGINVYEKIASDSTIEIDTRMQAAEKVYQMNANRGAQVFRRLSI
jgi:hypothetical protein